MLHTLIGKTSEISFNGFDRENLVTLKYHVHLRSICFKISILIIVHNIFHTMQITVRLAIHMKITRTRNDSTVIRYRHCDPASLDNRIDQRHAAFLTGDCNGTCSFCSFVLGDIESKSIGSDRACLNRSDP